MITTYMTGCVGCMEGTLHPVHDDGSEVIQEFVMLEPAPAGRALPEACDCSCHVSGHYNKMRV